MSDIIRLKESENPVTGDIVPLSLHLHALGCSRALHPSLDDLVPILWVIREDSHEQHEIPSLSV
jgi:hypothetical protein